MVDGEQNRAHSVISPSGALGGTTALGEQVISTPDTDASIRDVFGTLLD